jgi:hypothetical protein
MRLPAMGHWGVSAVPLPLNEGRPTPDSASRLPQRVQALIQAV